MCHAASVTGEICSLYIWKSIVPPGPGPAMARVVTYTEPVQEWTNTSAWIAIVQR